jgi:hypothetical protein
VVKRRVAGFVLALVGCQPPSHAPRARPAPAAQAYTLVDLVGGWRWMLRTAEDGTTRVEDERWRFTPDRGVPERLAGRYVRSVEVRSSDRVPFHCDQRAWYRQRGVFDVTVEPESDGFLVHETGYITEPSPCDHGFRKTGDYHARLDGERLALTFDGGEQTLWQTDDVNAPVPDAPWPADYVPSGPWRWDATAYDPTGDIRDEHEWWEVTARQDTTRLDLTYRRRVTITSADGKPIPCANATTWSFDDAYVLEGEREEEHWHLWERAVEPGDHPCLRATPRRSLDEATAEQIGDYFVLEWRGKRRQVLYRPDASPR